MESKQRKRVRVKQRIRVKQRPRFKPRIRGLIFFLWSSVLVIVSALYLTNFVRGDKLTLGPTRMGPGSKQAKEVRGAILKIETLLQVIEKKIEEEQSLARDLNALIAQKRIIERSEFMNSGSIIRRFVELLDPIETFKRENDTDTKALLIKVKQAKAYLERNKTGSRRGARGIKLVLY